MGAHHLPKDLEYKLVKQGHNVPLYIKKAVQEKLERENENETE